MGKDGKVTEQTDQENPQDQGQEGAEGESASAFFNFPLDRNPGDHEPGKKKEETETSSEQDEGQASDSEQSQDDQENQGDQDNQADQQEEQDEPADESEPDLDRITEEDLNTFSPQAKGLYRALKKEREARQEAEKERDFIKLQQKFGPKKDENADESEQGDEDQNNQQDDPATLFKDKADDDFVSVAEVKRMLQIMRAADTKKEQDAAKQAERIRQQRAETMRQANEVDKHMRSTVKDYAESLHYAEKMMQNFPGLAMEFAHTARTKGAEEAAQYAYKLGKQHRDFGSGKFNAGGKGKADTQMRKDAKTVIRNTEKQRTSANAGPGNRTVEKYNQQELDDMEASDLATALASMSMTEFRRVPKRLRDKALMAA